MTNSSIKEHFIKALNFTAVGSLKKAIFIKKWYYLSATLNGKQRSYEINTVSVSRLLTREM